MRKRIALVSTKTFAVSFYRFLEGRAEETGEKCELELASLVDLEETGYDLGEVAFGKKNGLVAVGPDQMKAQAGFGLDAVLVYAPPKFSVERYGRLALELGSAFANLGLQSSESLVGDFRAKGLPIAGDYLDEQAGPTELLEQLILFFKERGVTPLSSYEIGAGGPELDEEARERRRLDELSKAQDKSSIFVGAVEPVDFMGDRRHYYIWLEAEAPLKSRITVDAWLKFEESPLLVGPALDVARALVEARERGVGGPLPSLARYFKRPLGMA